MRFERKCQYCSKKLLEESVYPNPIKTYDVLNQLQCSRIGLNVYTWMSNKMIYSLLKRSRNDCRKINTSLWVNYWITIICLEKFLRDFLWRLKKSIPPQYAYTVYYYIVIMSFCTSDLYNTHGNSIQQPRAYAGARSKLFINDRNYY